MNMAGRIDLMNHCSATDANTFAASPRRSAEVCEYSPSGSPGLMLLKGSCRV